MLLQIHYRDKTQKCIENQLVQSKASTFNKINISDKSLLELENEYKSDEYFSRKLEQPEEPYVKKGKRLIF